MRRVAHIRQTEREFKQQKRREFRAIILAMRDINFGCAYLPKAAYGEFTKARKHLLEAYEICKPWWRKA